MPASVDLATFKPASVGEFADGLLDQVVPLLGSKFAKFELEMSSHINDLSTAVLTTVKLLKDGTYSVNDADLAIHSQELFFNQILLRAEFLAYELAQSILETIFALVGAVVRNFTGLDIKF